MPTANIVDRQSKRDVCAVRVSELASPGLKTGARDVVVTDPPHRLARLKAFAIMA